MKPCPECGGKTEPVEGEQCCPACARNWVYEDGLLLGYWADDGSNTNSGEFHPVWEGCFEPEGEVEIAPVTQLDRASVS